VVLRASPLPNLLYGAASTLVALAVYPLVGPMAALFLGSATAVIIRAMLKARKKTPQMVADSQGVLSSPASSNLRVSITPCTEWLNRKLGLVHLDVVPTEGKPVLVFSDSVRLPN